jgi:hypothetical protein
MSVLPGVRGVRIILACGLFLAVPLMAAAQAEPDPAPTDMTDPNAPVTRTIEASAVESPFANSTVAEAAAVDEVGPQATPAPREKLPPGPPSRWP